MYLVINKPGGIQPLKPAKNLGITYLDSDSSRLANCAQHRQSQPSSPRTGTSKNTRDPAKAYVRGRVLGPAQERFAQDLDPSYNASQKTRPPKYSMERFRMIRQIIKAIDARFKPPWLETLGHHYLFKCLHGRMCRE